MKTGGIAYVSTVGLSYREISILLAQGKAIDPWELKDYVRWYDSMSESEHRYYYAPTLAQRRQVNPLG